MNYATLLAAINTAMATAGLTAAADPRDSTLTRAGRGNFDGSYLIINKSGAQPWPDLSTGPVHWHASLQLEVATELTKSVEEQSKTIENRARAVFENLVYASLPVARQLYEWDSPVTTRESNRKRLVWSITFKARWTE